MEKNEFTYRKLLLGHPLVTTNFVYAIYENEELIRRILYICSTKTERTLDDGRCEYYLEVYSRQATSQRKSVGKFRTRKVKAEMAFCLDSDYSLVCCSSSVATIIVHDHLLRLLGRFSMSC